MEETWRTVEGVGRKRRRKVMRVTDERGSLPSLSTDQTPSIRTDMFLWRVMQRGTKLRATNNEVGSRKGGAATKHPTSRKRIEGKSNERQCEECGKEWTRKKGRRGCREVHKTTIEGGMRCTRERTRERNDHDMWAQQLQMAPYAWQEDNAVQSVETVETVGYSLRGEDVV